MIKKLIKGIMILCGSIVFSVAIVGCKPTTILADNSPVLKSARPTPRKVNSVQTDTIYQWKDNVENFSFQGPVIIITGISYDFGNDPNDLDDPAYSLEIELDTADDGYLDFYVNEGNWTCLCLYTGDQQGGQGSRWTKDDNPNLYIRFWSVNSDIQTYVAPFLEVYDPNPRYALYVDNNFVADVFVNTRLQVETQALNNAGNFGRQITGIRDLSTLQMVYTFNSSGYKFLEGFTKSGTTNVIYGDFYVFVMTGPLYLNTKVINMANTYNNVYQNGYDDGYDDGELDGYNDGYQDGLNDNTAYELGLADSGRNVLANGWQAIISMVDSFFNVQIFPGFKVIYLIYISLGLLILGFAFKIFVH